MASATAFGPIIGPVGSIIWLPVTASGKIETGAPIVNVHGTSRPEKSMPLTLLAAILSLLAWTTLIFFTPLNAGAIHLLLAVSATLLVRWWALRA
jgi:hypothetical protein